MKLDEIVDLIVRENPRLSREKVLEMIRGRVEELGNLIDEEAAAVLVARELGVSLPREEVIARSAKLKISDLVPGLRNVNLRARVIVVSDIAELPREGGALEKLSVLLGDGSGVITLTLWGDQAREAKALLRPGCCVQLEKAYVKRFQDRVELGLSREGSIRVVEEDGDLPPLQDIVEGAGGVKVLKACRVYRTLGGSHLVYGVDHRGRKLKALVVGGRPPEGPFVATVVREGEEGRPLAVLRDPMPLEVEIEGGYEPEREWIDSGRAAEVYLGLFAALEPYQSGGVLHVGGRDKCVRVRVFEDDVFRRLAELDPEPLSTLELTNLRVSGRGPVARRTSSISTVGPPPGEEPERGFVRGGQGLVRLRGALVSLRVKFKSLGPVRVAFLRGRLDDGTGQATLMTSSREVVESLLCMGYEEIAEYHEEGVLDTVLRDVQGEVLGRDLEVTGYLFEDGVFAPLRLGP